MLGNRRINVTLTRDQQDWPVPIRRDAFDEIPVIRVSEFLAGERIGRGAVQREEVSFIGLYFGGKLLGVVQRSAAASHVPSGYRGNSGNPRVVSGCH